MCPFIFQNLVGDRETFEFIAKVILHQKFILEKKIILLVDEHCINKIVRKIYHGSPWTMIKLLPCCEKKGK